jgi:hypothetical protein
MFGGKKEEKIVAVVKTKDELKAAVKRNEPCIEVTGNLAKNMKWMVKLSKKQITALVALLGVGTAATVVSPVATPAIVAATTGITGAEIAQIIFASSLGIAMICSIFKGYDVEASMDGTVRLTRKMIHNN